MFKRVFGKLVFARKYYSIFKDRLFEKYSGILDEAKEDYGYDRSEDFVFHHLKTGVQNAIPSTLSGFAKEERSRILIKVLKYMDLSGTDKKKYEQQNINDMPEIRRLLPQFKKEINEVYYIPRKFHEYLHNNNIELNSRAELQREYKTFYTAGYILEECDKLEGTIKGKSKAIWIMLNFLVMLDNKEGKDAKNFVEKLYNKLKHSIKDLIQ